MDRLTIKKQGPPSQGQQDRQTEAELSELGVRSGRTRARGQRQGAAYHQGSCGGGN
jgi:hypothetical protein